MTHAEAQARSPTSSGGRSRAVELNGPITVDINSDGTVASITVPIARDGTDAASNASFRVLRDEIVPQTVGTIPGDEVGVTGLTAEWKDFSDG